MCGLDSENSGLVRSSTATGWFLINSFISLATSSSGVYRSSVSSSEGGFRKPFAALIPGAAAMKKPVVVKKMAIAITLRVRLRKDFRFGASAGKVAGKMSVFSIGLLKIDGNVPSDRRRALLLNV